MLLRLSLHQTTSLHREQPLLGHQPAKAEAVWRYIVHIDVRQLSRHLVDHRRSWAVSGFTIAESAHARTAAARANDGQQMKLKSTA